jgi:hypothetical protein
MEELIKRQLPSGTPAAQVVAFLDQQHIEHSDYSKPPGPCHRLW